MKELKILEESNDPRDWDTIMSTVFRNIGSHKFYVEQSSIFSTLASIFSYIFELFISFFKLLLLPEMRFTSVLIFITILILYLHKRYNYGLFILFLSGCFIFGFLYTYYDCNRQMEIEELAELMEQQSDPCQSASDTRSSIWGFFFGHSSKEKCIEHLKKKHQLRMPFCRPDDVFLTFINDILLKQFQRIVEKCTTIFQHSIQKFPFPYNIVAIVIFGLFLPLFFKMVVKHFLSPRVWYRPEIHHNQPDLNQRNHAAGGDQLTGENLRLFLESVKYRTIADVHAIQNMVSGVQILEDIPQIENEEIKDKSEDISESSKDSSSFNDESEKVKIEKSCKSE